MSSAHRRVAGVVAAGARISDAANPLGIEARERLLATSGLSREGIELALRDHLETEARSAEIDALVASLASAPRCHVVLAANVCTAALRAIALATATAPIACVRPSRRDPVVADVLVRALASDPIFAANEGSIAIVDAIDPAPGDEVHVYGSNETIAAIEANLPAGALFRGHGSGLGIAVVGAAHDVVSSARAIARDVVPFDQRGCLSPRIVLVEGAPRRARDFAEALSGALTSLGKEIPRGEVRAEEAAAVSIYRASIDAVGAIFAGLDHVVGFDPAPRALVLPPPARIVHVVAASAETAAELLASFASTIAAIGADDEGDLARTVFAVAPRARRSLLGAMQRPPLDGPVDLRTRPFLRQRSSMT